MKKSIRKEIEEILEAYSNWSAHCHHPEKYPVEPKSKMHQRKAVLKLEKLFLAHHLHKIIIDGDRYYESR